jgi:hypothetical protein
MLSLENSGNPVPHNRECWTTHIVCMCLNIKEVPKYLESLYKYPQLRIGCVFSHDKSIEHDIDE